MRRVIVGLAWGLAHVAALGAVLAALPATSPAQSATITRILTDWGTFRCAAIRCIPDRGVLSLYWAAPVLYVTKDHIPMLRRRCVVVSARSNVWDCRNEAVARLAGSWGDVQLDGFWDWLPALADAPDD